MTAIANDEKIPNNVNLAGDKRLQRALEQWLPNYIDWWKQVGPEGRLENDVYLRTAVSVDAAGWAQFGYVKMPEYRWGIFLADAVPDRKIGFGDHMGEPAWQEVPGEYRNMLRRIIVTQADTEPASVEQQRLLGLTAPSLYDMRNLFQVNVEEGRHLWAMVYLLQSYFGKDGREEAEGLLERRSGDSDRPRILGTFNEPIDNWLDFFMFTMFTDRDGKYQLGSLAESGFDPLSRTCRFMLTEEAHHMFVGETGIERVVQRTVELMKAAPGASGPADVMKAGGIPLDMVQRHINFWFSSSTDLFGGEISSNAADFFASGLKGRYNEKTNEDHRALEGSYKMSVIEDGAVRDKDVPLRNAMNEVLRDNYVEDCQRAVDKWNRVLAKAGIDFTFRLPSRRFHRNQGIYAGLHFDTEGRLLDEASWTAQRDAWLPSQADRQHVRSLMKPCIERGKIAGWIAPPGRGINNQSFDFEYVKLS